MLFKNRCIPFTAIICSLFLLTQILPIFAQSEPSLPNSQVSVATQTETPVDTSLSSVVVHADALKEAAAGLPEKISSIKDLKKGDQAVEAFKQKLATFKQKLEEIKKSGAYGFEQISFLRAEVRKFFEEITELSAQATGKLEEAGSLKQIWKSNETTWAERKNALTAEAGSSLANIFKDAEKIIRKAQKSLEGIETPLVAFQQQVLEQQRAAESIGSELDKILVEMRKDLFRKSRPAMFTPTFFRQFNSETWQEFWLGLATLEFPASKFYSTYGWIFVLQLIIFFAAMYFFKTLKNRKLEQLKLGFILDRYVSASLLLGILLPTPLFEEKPRLVSLILAVLVAISAARLVAGVIERPWRRRLIYILVALYLLVQFFSFISLPMTLMRTFIALVGLAGVIFCRWRASVNKDDGSSTLFNVGVKIGGATMLLVFLAQVAGYVAMSNHLLETLLKTVFLGLIAWMINLVAHGALEMFFDNEYIRKNKIIDKHHRLFIKRSSFIVDILVVFLAIANMLAFWGLFDTAAHAATAILSLGFSLQGIDLTLGLLVSAIVVLYIALFASWFIQAILDEEVYPRKKVDRGVGISINRLIQYAFVVIGISMAFSTLGIGMQNITVIIGALGVGIGFGLQNIVNNFASGLILLFERSIKVGDVVQVNGEWGLIKNLGLRATVVETFDRSEMIVPNSDLVASTVTNWTLSDRQVRLIVPVGVAYGSDVELVTRLLKEIAQNNPRIMKFPEPSVLFLNFGASSLDFEMRCWVANIDIRLGVLDEINREIDRSFHENNVEIPFPQQDLHIRSMDEPFKNAVNELKNGVVPTPSPVSDS